MSNSALKKPSSCTSGGSKKKKKNTTVTNNPGNTSSAAPKKVLKKKMKRKNDETMQKEEQSKEIDYLNSSFNDLYIDDNDMSDHDIDFEEDDYSDIDDEGPEGYKIGGYHPVSIGEKYCNDRYTIIKKLGWGHFSTVWMCHDSIASKTSENGISKPKFVALKVQKSASHYTEAARDEIELLTYIEKTAHSSLYLQEMRENQKKSKDKFQNSRNNEKCTIDTAAHVITLNSYFEHQGPHGLHICMTFDIMGENLLSLIKRYKYVGISIPIVKRISRQICCGLDFLHRHCQIIHTDLKPENILITSNLNAQVSVEKLNEILSMDKVSTVNKGSDADKSTKSVNSGPNLKSISNVENSFDREANHLECVREKASKKTKKKAKKRKHRAVKKHTNEGNGSGTNGGTGISSANTTLNHSINSTGHSSTNINTTLHHSGANEGTHNSTRQHNKLKKKKPKKSKKSMKHSIDGAMENENDTNNCISNVPKDSPHRIAAEERCMMEEESSINPLHIKKLDDQLALDVDLYYSDMEDEDGKDDNDSVYEYTQDHLMIDNNDGISDEMCTHTHFPSWINKTLLTFINMKTKENDTSIALDMNQEGCMNNNQIPLFYTYIDKYTPKSWKRAELDQYCTLTNEEGCLYSTVVMITTPRCVLDTFGAACEHHNPTGCAIDSSWYLRLRTENNHEKSVSTPLEIREALQDIEMCDVELNSSADGAATSYSNIDDYFIMRSIGFDDEFIGSLITTSIIAGVTDCPKLFPLQTKQSNAEKRKNELHADSKYKSKYNFPDEDDALDDLDKPVLYEITHHVSMTEHILSYMETILPTMKFLCYAHEKSEAVGSSSFNSNPRDNSHNIATGVGISDTSQPICMEPCEKELYQRISKKFNHPINAMSRMYDTLLIGFDMALISNYYIKKHLDWKSVRRVGSHDFTPINIAIMDLYSDTKDADGIEFKQEYDEKHGDSKRMMYNEDRKDSKYGDESVEINPTINSSSVLDDLEHDMLKLYHTLQYPQDLECHLKSIQTRLKYFMNPNEIMARYFESEREASLVDLNNDLEEDEAEDYLDENSIITNSNEELDKKYQNTDIKIVDLGNACWVNKHFTDDIQTRQYRAPEVILMQGYDTSCDIFSLGCIIFELITGDLLFDPHTGKTWDRCEDHLAMMIELMGEFPRKMYSITKTNNSNKKNRCLEYFNSDGSLRHIEHLKYWRLQDVLIDKYKFTPLEAVHLASFMEPMLELDPTKRVTARECINHPWLLNDRSDCAKMRDDMDDWNESKSTNNSNNNSTQTERRQSETTDECSIGNLDMVSSSNSPLPPYEYRNQFDKK